MFDRNKDKQQDKPETSGSAAPAAESSYSSAPRPAAASSGKSATLGATIKVKGDISGDENLMIEGQVEGTVNLASHELTVGKSGKVHADVTAKVIRIDGEVHGDITGKEKVFVSSTSNIKGNIITPKMTLEEGARFKGTIDIDPSHANGSSPVASLKSGTPTDKTS
ncbi:bactofilin family protein [Pseudohongiella sp.]|uniref:Polymer-forming cytoskeletal protein n=1 Tax=marine sediment metagenome TaxID=412755 RepID=A0A0F9WJI5_9ZZZZ|nr:polymer-forming cytoskeletal protein [Pseudohongiella sp.]HDZ08201.1 polymer-forming cytoskeletal protein [Pseudohongiella sp.]HEA63169.1 polymer-forming cytoskeletal protein [Pseudohongiella sp.]